MIEVPRHRSPLSSEAGTVQPPVPDLPTEQLNTATETDQYLADILKKRCIIDSLFLVGGSALILLSLKTGVKDNHFSPADLLAVVLHMVMQTVYGSKFLYDFNKYQALTIDDGQPKKAVSS